MRWRLAKLADLIDWPAFAQQWGSQFESTTGRPALPTRLMAALLYLKHVYALSGEDAVERWVRTPTGSTSAATLLPPQAALRPVQPRALALFAGEAGCEWLLAHSIEAARRAGVIKRSSLQTVVLDTTVQPKEIAHPTDSRFLNRAREQLVAAAQKAGLALRQSYARVGKAAETQAGR